MKGSNCLPHLLAPHWPRPYKRYEAMLTGIWGQVTKKMQGIWKIFSFCSQESALLPLKSTEQQGECLCNLIWLVILTQNFNYNIY